MQRILVGSSDSVLLHDRGAEIDTFDEVVRFNRAPIKGYEKYVGIKTTHRFINPQIVWNEPCHGQSLDLLRTLRGVEICTSAAMHPSDFYEIYHSSCTYRHYMSDAWMGILRTLNLEVLKSHNPTVGFDGILHSIAEGVDVTIYGFDLDADRTFNHYWRQERYNSTYHKHAYEKGIIRELINNGWIKQL